MVNKVALDQSGRHLLRLDPQLLGHVVALQADIRPDEPELSLLMFTTGLLLSFLTLDADSVHELSCSWPLHDWRAVLSAVAHASESIDPCRYLGVSYPSMEDFVQIIKSPFMETRGFGAFWVLTMLEGERLGRYHKAHKAAVRDGAALAVLDALQSSPTSSFKPPVCLANAVRVVTCVAERYPDYLLHNGALLKLAAFLSAGGEELLSGQAVLLVLDRCLTALLLYALSVPLPCTTLADMAACKLDLDLLVQPVADDTIERNGNLSSLLLAKAWAQHQAGLQPVPLTAQQQLWVACLLRRAQCDANDEHGAPDYLLSDDSSDNL